MPAIRGPKSKKKTRRYTRDLDAISADISDPAHLARHKATMHADDLPALGMHYCVSCAKFFESETNLVAHTRGKVHKRRVKQLAEGAHTQREAEEAVGLRTDNGTRTTEEMAVDEEL
ncbi:hypothetical protein EJ06DRAFT_42373 [Trichodelitschia bisporula]|uniref:C2H2-type domain-containing protein n=1 Tax=Trichodelitschia bisporula TaxID=703511 RepID=A0A6G1HVR0_9PEZI|nr:hypothetical protein EJ06DRAFT_42373 [Trichodelitschia bisporula]